MGRKSGGGHHSHHSGHHHGQGEDHYVTGNTNWDSYELPQLVAMVNEKVDIPALVRLADDWRYAGDDLMDSAKDLGDALDRLMDFWSGEAAEQARTDVALNAQWVSDLGVTARAVGDPVEESAGALQAAQDQMPDLQVVPQSPGSAPVGATNGEAAGGPLGAAIGGVAAGSESAAQASEEQAKLKQQAVETMRRFETAAMSIDAAIPEFVGPDTTLHPDPKERHPGGPPVEPPPTTRIIVDTNATLTWQQLTGAGTSAADFGGHGAGASHGGLAAGGAFGAGGHAGGMPGGGAVSPGPMPGRGPGTGSVSGATPPPLERVGGPGTLPAAAALPVEMEGHGGMGGAPMAGGGMGMGAGGGTGNDHRRRFPFEEEDPFSPGQKASPPVIGL